MFVKLDLQDNIIGIAAVEYLSAMTFLSTLKVDISTPNYSMLWRVATGEKKGKKMKGKKKK